MKKKLINNNIDSYQQKALCLYNDCFKQKAKDLNIKLFYDGYTNISFLVEDKHKQKYLIKLSKNEINTLFDESEVYLKYFKQALIYHSKNNYILKWFDHKELNINDSKNIKLLEIIFKEIKSYHQLKFKQEVVEFDFFAYKPIYQKSLMVEYYQKILQKFQFHHKCVSHGDVNFKNILYLTETKKIKLIDYEWTRINYEWFDYINLISENCLCSKQLFDLLRKFLNHNYSDQEIYELIFVKWFFSWSWAKANKNLKGIKQYKKFAWKQTKAYFNYLINHS